MSVSAELLCSFELLKPLDSSALKNHIKRGRNKRQQSQQLNSPVCLSLFSWVKVMLTSKIAGLEPKCPELLSD